MTAVSSPRPASPIDAPDAKARQKPAIQQVFAEHSTFVWRTLRALGVPESAIDDSVQEVFLIVNAKLPEFEGRSSLRTWICSIAYRVGANARRKLRRVVEVDLSLVTAQANEPDPEQRAQALDSARFVEKFCAGLSEGMRDVFVLCLLEERPAAEVGALLGLSPHTVSSRIRLLRESFRRELAAREQMGGLP